MSPRLRKLIGEAYRSIVMLRQPEENVLRYVVGNLSADPALRTEAVTEAATAKAEIAKMGRDQCVISTFISDLLDKAIPLLPAN